MAFILLVNLLIAMMGDTYTRIAEIKNEWMRQVRVHSVTVSFSAKMHSIQWCLEKTEQVLFFIQNANSREGRKLPKHYVEFTIFPSIACIKGTYILVAKERTQGTILGPFLFEFCRLQN